MLSRVFITGQPFQQTCAYVCQDVARAEILAVEGVRGHDLRLLDKDFEVQHEFMPEKEKPVFHGMLSFPHGEDPGNEKIVEITRKYLEEIEMGHTQYAIVRHTDRAHVHVHIIANRVNNNGIVIGEGLIAERGLKAAQKLTREYNLTPDHGKNLKQTNLEALRETDVKRYRLYQEIKDHLPGCRTLEDLEKRLMEKGITVRYKYDPASGERQGISFRIEKQCFKGSQVDKDYSLKGLERLLALQLKEELVQGPGVRQAEGAGEEERIRQGLEERESVEEGQRLRLRL